MNIIEELNQIRHGFEAVKGELLPAGEIAKLKIAYLGRKGIIADLFDRLPHIPIEDRKEYGKALNQLKTFITTEIEALEATSILSLPKTSTDATLPAIHSHQGGLHPLSLILNEIIDVFRGMGFTVETGPEAELISYNFDKLNTPAWHPARDLTDTFYLKSTKMDRLLRTETSPIQIRVMERKKPPIRIIAPGRVYRSDKPDATHSPVFMQVEGLYVDKGVTFADLKGTVLAFYRGLFGSKVVTRFRPHFFPFTEPSAEVDMSCIFCNGKGCRMCKQSGWLEMGGSGMVDPNVLTGVGIDPEEYTGWAFGLGIERIAILKYGVDDIRLFYENDLRFLTQFS
jgi:phenylalanyl-tRNA synthetase alpha chain